MKNSGRNEHGFAEIYYEGLGSGEAVSNRHFLALAVVGGFHACEIRRSWGASDFRNRQSGEIVSFPC